MAPRARPRRPSAFVVLVATALLPVLLAPACPTWVDGTVSLAWWRGRQMDWLLHATEVLEPGSPMNVAAHMERALRDPGHSIPAGTVQMADWQDRFDFIHDLRDTSDFRVMELLQLLYAYRDEPAVAPAIAPDVWQEMEDTVLGFKYWFTDPTPAGISDDMWYWSENHLIIFHAAEYLAGQLYPERTFAVTGLTGAEHRARARARIQEWMDLRLRFGFFEFHSNVYWKFSLQPLMALVEFAEDDAITGRAATLVDLLLFDLALHTFQGSYGVPHGRSYKKDKMTALDENTFSIAELLFDQQDQFDYTRRGDLALHGFARSQRYRPPQAVVEVGRSTDPMVDRERMGVVFDEDEALSLDPVHPLGFSYTDPAALPLWWSMSNLTAWQIVPLTIDTMDTYDLWSSEGFAEFGDLSVLQGIDPGVLQVFAQATAKATSMALLEEVNTYTFRTADYMMASAQDYRKGRRSNQGHFWQATFGPNAMVMTSHPGEPPRQTTNWRDDGQPGRWTGTATIPRIGQHENVAIQIYTPGYQASTSPLLQPLTSQELYTHAYFPQDHFDEVVRAGHWTFGRLGDAYIALWSWRLPQYESYDPAVVATNGMTGDFDLRAPGGANNVWIAECTSLAESGWTFAEFQAEILAADVTATEGVVSGAQLPAFDVVYESPTRGTVEMGWTGPLTVDGVDHPLGGYPRFENPWTRVPFEGRVVGISDLASRTGLRLEFDTPLRFPWRRSP